MSNWWSPFRITVWMCWGLLLFQNKETEAQSPSTLKEVLEYSKQNYPLIKSKEAAWNSADKKVSASKTGRLPSVILQDQYTVSSYNNMTGSFFPTDGIGISTTGAARPEDTYQGIFGSLASMTVDWKLFNFGKIRADIHAARQDQVIAQADYDNELFQQQIKVIDAYLSIREAQRVVTAQENNLKRALELKNVVKAGVEAGIRPAVDSSIASAEYAKASLQLSESRRNEKVKRVQLAYLMGEPNINLSIDTTSFQSQSFPDTSAFAGESHHPLLRLYRAQVNSSIARARVAKLNYMPSLSFVASGLARGYGVSRTSGEVNTDFTGATSYSLFNYLVGVSFRWNISAVVKQVYEYKAEKYQVERAQFTYDDQENALKRQTQEADAQLDLSSEQVRLAPSQLEASRHAFAQAEARYKSGLSDILLLNQSFYLLNKAEVDYYIAINNSWKALLIKSAASGDLSVFLNQVK